MLGDNHVKAFEILRKLHHMSDDREDVLAREEYLQIKKQIELDSSKPRSLWAILKIPSYRRRLFTAMFLEWVLSRVLPASKQRVSIVTDIDPVARFLFQSTGVLVVNNYQVHSALFCFDPIHGLERGAVMLKLAPRSFSTAT